MTDGELVRQTLAGGKAAQEELARRWSPRLLAICEARVGRGASEDIAQDSLIRALKSLAQLESPDRFGPWVRSIAVRACIDWLRRRRIMERPMSAVVEGAMDGGFRRASANGRHPLEIDEDRNELWSAIGGLPEENREVLLLFYCDNLSYDAVADLLDVSRATVNSRLARARDLLRRRLDPEGERPRGLHQRS